MTELHMVSQKHSKQKYDRGETQIVKVRVSASDFKVGYKMCGKMVVIDSKGKKVWRKYPAGPVRKCYSGIIKARSIL